MISPVMKNLLIYRLSRDIQIASNEAEFAGQLQHFAFSPCGSQDMAKTGWIAPLNGLSDQLFHRVNNQLILVIRREEKILPSSVLRDELAKKVNKVEAEQARKLKKTEKDALRDEILHTLLPRAFTKNSLIKIWIDLDKSLVLVDTSSARRAEDALALLRKTLGSLPVVPLTAASPAELTMTGWIKNSATPAGFTVGDEAELKAMLENGGVAKVKKQDLCSDEIESHIEAGKVITSLALDWQERISFTINDSLILKRIKFADSLLEQNSDIDREDAAARFDADILLFTSELATLISDLIIIFDAQEKQ